MAKAEKKSQARKESSVPTKIFTIGAFPKLSKEDRLAPQMKVIADQIFAAHRYRRELIEIENTRRSKFRDLRRTLSRKLNKLEAEVDRIETKLQDCRKGLKAKKERRTAEQLKRLQRIDALKKERRLLYPKIKAEHVLINKKHFTRVDKLFAKRKANRLAKAAAKKGRAKLGPNDADRRALMQALDDEMLTMADNEAWIAKRKIDLEAELACRIARSETLCTTGTYQAVEEAVNRAKRDAPGGDLRQKRWDYTGRVGIQLTDERGLSVERALSGQDEKLKIEIREGVPLRRSKSDIFYPSHSRPVDLHAKERKARARLRAREPERVPYRKAVMVRMKIAGRAKDGVHLDIEGVLHRPLPSDGIIKWAYLAVNRVGYEMVYELQLVIESKTFAIEREGKGSDKKLAVNFGWRVLPNGNIRVATTYDGSKINHVVLKAEMLESHRFIESLIGFSDDHFDLARDQTIEWLGALDPADRKALTPLLRSAMPGHLRDDLKTIKQIGTYMTRWRGHERLAKVANVVRDLYLQPSESVKLWGKWKTHRLGAKKDLFAPFDELSSWLQARGIKSANARMAFYLEAWRRKDRHLINWARNGQTKLALHRREIYRITAAEWAKVYDKIAIEKWDKSKTAETPKYENDKRVAQEENANSIRQFAGVSRFTMALAEKFGDDLLQEGAIDISRVHFACGGTAIPSNPDKPHLSPTPELKCGKCKLTYDQDNNAARHLWHRAFPEGEGAGSSSTVKGERSRGRKTRESTRKSASRRDQNENLDSAAE